MKAKLLLEDLNVLDFGHTVMGPSAGLILADLGADVIKVEPTPAGDPTRTLKGFGSGYFAFFNRNKRSISVDLKSSEGKDIAYKLIRRADVLIENFAPGTMKRLGLDYERVRRENPRLIYASLKGFLPGPYDKRLALDEVVQMMTGLAYMTGPTGRPLRAGSSVVDIAGGMFAVIGILAALRDRDHTGEGRLIEAALFEAGVFLIGQHLSYAAQSGKPVPPMPERVSAWAVYDLFAAADGSDVFVGITTDAQWRRFCDVLGRRDLAEDLELATNNGRIDARDRLIPLIRSIFAKMSSDEIIAICEKAVVPFAPIARPEDLFEDPHLQATGGLQRINLPDGTSLDLPRLPLRLSDASMELRRNPPGVGADTAAILRELGVSEAEIHALAERGVITARDEHQALPTVEGVGLG